MQHSIDTNSEITSPGVVAKEFLQKSRGEIATYLPDVKL